jgi:hypothetical protein
MSFGSLGTGGFSVPGGGPGGGMFGGPIMGGAGGGDIIDTGNEFVDTIGSTVIERGSNRLLDEIGLGQDQDFGAPSGGTQAPYTPGATGQGSGQTDAPMGGERPGGSGQPGVTPIFRPPPREDTGGGEQQEAGVIGDTASLTQNLVIGIALFFAYQVYTDL